MKSLDATFVRAFAADAMERAAETADDILWVKCDEDFTDGHNSDSASRSFTATVRENFDGAGRVRTFRVTVTAVET